MADGLQEIGLRNIEHFINGEQVIRALKDAVIVPKIIFLDVRIPLMDGYEVMSHIEGMPKARNTKLVLMSSIRPDWFDGIEGKHYIMEKQDVLRVREQVQQAAKDLLSI